MVTFFDIQKAQYASDLLYIIAISLAKISVLQLLEQLAVTRWHIKATRGASVVVILWFISSFFTCAFKCGATQPWNSISRSCINIVSHLDPIIITTC